MPIATAGDFQHPGENHTTHLSAVDEEGNIVALTPTLGDIFGSGVTAFRANPVCHFLRGRTNRLPSRVTGVAISASVQPRRQIDPGILRSLPSFSNPNSSILTRLRHHSPRNTIDFPLRILPAVWRESFRLHLCP